MEMTAGPVILKGTPYFKPVHCDENLIKMQVSIIAQSTNRSDDRWRVMLRDVRMKAYYMHERLKSRATKHQKWFHVLHNI